MPEKIRLGISCAGVAHRRDVKTVWDSFLVNPSHFGKDNCWTRPDEPCQATGIPNSWQQAQSGSQYGSFIRFKPFLVNAGSASMTTPRWPRCTQRSTSATTTSISLMYGIIATGTYRSLTARHSPSASLYAWTH